MITILGGGIAGAALARALAVRGRRDVVVFDPRPPAAGSTGRATGGFRTQFESKLNIALSLTSRPFFVERAERIRFQSVGYLYPAEDPATAQKLKQRAEVQVAAGLPIAHPDPATLIPFFDTSRVIATNFCHLDGCTGYLAHPFGKSRCKKDRVCLHWLQMDVHRGYNLRT